MRRIAGFSPICYEQFRRPWLHHAARSIVTSDRSARTAKRPGLEAPRRVAFPALHRCGQAVSDAGRASYGQASANQPGCAASSYVTRRPEHAHTGCCSPGSTAHQPRRDRSIASIPQARGSIPASGTTPTLPGSNYCKASIPITWTPDQSPVKLLTILGRYGTTYRVPSLRPGSLIVLNEE